MSELRDRVVAEARSWIGTPYHHEGRLKGVGVDCIGIVIGVARDLGLSRYDVKAYPADPYAYKVQKEADREMRRLDLAHVAAGDVLLFRVSQEPQHFGILTRVGGTMSFVHAFEKVGKVVENDVDRFWLPRIMAAYALPGVD